MKISIIIPAYNEEKRIGNTLEEYGRFFKNLKNNKIIDFEILIVINNTKDRTEEIVKIYSKRYKEIRYLNFKESGKGFAIIEGFKEALKGKNDIIGFVDADMATSPDAYYELIKNLNNYDGIFASRYLKSSIVDPKQSIQRIISSRIFNFLIRVLFFMNYRDTQCGAKLFKKQAIEAIISNLSITKWAFDVDLLYLLKKKGFRLKEHQTIWKDREYSKINLKKAGLKMMLAIIRLRLINSKLKDFVRFYDKMPEKLKISHRI
ncbi:glycosyltransferase [Candidatus Pacearchaeota archaeon]|nr:glycosyltransferase [Candidatus Pacearchaeota archaeon]